MKHFLKTIAASLLIIPLLFCFTIVPSVSAKMADCDEMKDQMTKEGIYTTEEINAVHSQCLQDSRGISDTKSEEQGSEGTNNSGGTPSSASSNYVSSNCDYLLGMPSWNCNVTIKIDKNGESLKSGIWTIAANVATSITVIAAYLVVGYIIYGGYLYMFSNGEAGKVATGKKAIHQALLGLAIVISANVILNGFRVGLGVASFSEDCVRNGGCVDPSVMVTSALQWVIGIAGVISAIFIVMGGTSYIMSRGDAGKLQTAKQTILYALIGLAIVALAELIVTFASNIINNANDSAFINQNIISKEYHEN